MKRPGIVELLIAGGTGVVGLLFFASMQTRQPYDLVKIRFCPQSANHPQVLENNVNTLNEERSKQRNNIFNKKNKQSKPYDFDIDAQEKLDKKFCHQPRYVLAEEWERYGKFGSKIPYKGDAISFVENVPKDNPNYIYANFGAVVSLWVIYRCLKYRESTLREKDFIYSENEKTIARDVWLQENNTRNLKEYYYELDLNLTKEVRAQKHQMMRETLGVADTENEAIRNQLNLETAMLSRKAHHAKLQKDIAENLRDATKADAEAKNILKKGGKNDDTIEPISEEQIKKQGVSIVEAIANFGLELEYMGASTAPSVVRHRFKFLPGKKSKISDFQKLADDLALNLSLADTPRIVRDKGEIVVEVPRNNREYPHINDILKLLKKPEGESVVLLGGIDTNNELMQLDVLASPDCHGLGAGATKSGKTQGIYAQIASLIHMYTPYELKIAIYDGKSSLILPDELKPWLFCEVAIANQGGEFINEIEKERVKRLDLREGYRDISEFNKENPDERLPYIVVIMDEYSVDREMFEGEKSNTDTNIMKRLGKLARSEGIHLLPFDQSAKDENISNRVKENLGFRLVFRMVDQKCSSYLEVDGAHQLLGNGDLIVKWEGRQYRCQMPNCSPTDLQAIAKRRCDELKLSLEASEMIQFTSKGGQHWYEALQDWAITNKPSRDEIIYKWVQMSGVEPKREQLDIFMENLEAIL